VQSIKVASSKNIVLQMTLKIKNVLLFACLSIPFSIWAQRAIEPTDTFKITGKIKQEKSFTLEALDSYPKVAIKDQILYNHKGEIKDTVRNLKGVLLKTVLADIEFTNKKPKELNEFYFTCIASDGYKVVFSWNEIYNTETGNNLYIITESGGRKITEMSQRILLAATSDLKPGRRYIKFLQEIKVKRDE
jgi:hypothetical protein